MFKEISNNKRIANDMPNLTDKCALERWKQKDKKKIATIMNKNEREHRTQIIDDFRSKFIESIKISWAFCDPVFTRVVRQPVWKVVFSISISRIDSYRVLQLRYVL